MKGIPKIKKTKQAVKAKNSLISQAVFKNKLNSFKYFVTDCLEKEPLKNDVDVLPESARYTVFISICDGVKRAKVFHASDMVLGAAWNKVSSIVCSKVEKDNLNPVWIKVDIVDSVEKAPYANMKSMFLSAFYQKFFRKGFSFDANMNMAFLECEANSYKIYDYTLIPMKASKPGDEDVPCINMVQLNKYLDANGIKADVSIPEYIYFFECHSFFMDEAGEFYNLYGDSIHCGRRKMSSLDKGFIEDILTLSTKYLTRQMKEDRSFVYGYFPSFNKTLTSYNILRHSGTIWSMMCAYDVTMDETLMTTINNGLYYMLGQIAYRDEEAYLIERKDCEIKLGGNGIAIITLVKYMENYGYHNLGDVVTKLANGILCLQDKETGKFTHVLNADDYTVKEEFRTVYYDGESAYALVKAYEVTNDERYLDAARLAIDYFIDNNYIVYRDHWLAYAMNSFTQHVKEEKYYTFALKNAWESRVAIRNQATSYHTYLELLLETYDIFKRMKSEGIDNEYLNSMNEDEFVEIITFRALHMLDGFFFPEYAMYMSKPSVILDSFFVRHDEFRARIDDNQHFIDGYAKYYKLIL